MPPVGPDTHQLSWQRRAASSAIFAVGAALALGFVTSFASGLATVVLVLVVTGLDAARPLLRSPRPRLRALGALGWVGTACAYAGWTYLAVAWGSILAWTVPAWAVALLVSAGAGALASQHPKWRGPTIAPALALGGWIALCLLGWQSEERSLRCDDVRRVESTSGLRIVVASRDRAEECEPGTRMPLGRYPRVVWEPEEANRLIVLTSAASGEATAGDSRFDGSVCEVRDGAVRACVGEGKAQGLAVSPAHDAIFVASWGRFGPRSRGDLLELPLHGPLEVRREVPTERSLGELFYDADADRIYGFTDEGFEILPFDATTLAPGLAIEAPLLPPGAIRYDLDAGEGMICAASGPIATLDGEPFLAVAVRGSPLALRPLGPGVIARLGLTWGCDFDPRTRRAWVALPHLAAIATIDYDSGELVDVDVVEAGLRSLTVDSARRRLYATNFLAGHVLALDLETMDVVARWDVGRFPRTARIARDGRHLWVGTNVGVIEIDLETGS